MDELSEKVEVFQNMLIAQATGGGADLTNFQTLRDEIVTSPLLKDLVPRFLRTCRSPSEFWQFIKYKFPNYAERRQFLWDEFRPMFERLDGSKATPADGSVSLALAREI